MTPTLVFSGLALFFSGLAFYFNWKARKLRRESEAAYQQYRQTRQAMQRRTFDRLYGAKPQPEPAVTRPVDPEAFGAFVVSHVHDTTEIRMVESPPGPEAWVPGGGDFSGGGASGSWDSSPDVSSPSDSGSSSCDSGSSDGGSCGGTDP